MQGLKAKRGAWCLLAAVACALAPAACAWAEDAAEETAEPAGKWYSGSFRAGLDFRSSSDDTDFDLDQVLRMTVAKPGQDKLSLHGALWLTEDLDGDESENSVLRGIDDSYDSDVRARLLSLYLESKGLWGDSTLRLGRQRILESPAYNRVDGLYFKKRLNRWEWYVFGGARASVYHDTHDDLTVGGGVAVNATAKTRLSLDAYYGEDERDGSRRGSRYLGLPRWGYPVVLDDEVDSTLVAFTVMHQLAPRHSAYARYTLHDGDSDELQLSLTGAVSERDVVYNLVYRKRLEVLEDRTHEATGYYRVLGPQNEYDDLLATVQIPLSTKWALGLETQVHMADGDSTYTANRDYQRYATVLSVDGLRPGLDASVALEYWDVDDGESSLALTGEVSKAWEKWALKVGVDYERFEDRITYYRAGFTELERWVVFFTPGVFPNYRPFIPGIDTAITEVQENVYSAYAKVSYALCDRSDVWAKLSYESDDGDDSPYWRLEAMYSTRF